MKRTTVTLMTLLLLMLSAPLLAQEEPAPETLPEKVEAKAEAVEETVQETAEEAHEAVHEAIEPTPSEELEQTEPTGELSETEGYAETDEYSTDEMPRTAGFMPLIALLGLGALGSALGLRRLQRK